jgi:hypothetical protein
MIAVAAGYNETASVNLDLEEEFFYAVESSDQSFGNSSHLEKDRSLQFQFVEIPQIVIPTLPPVEFPQIIIPSVPPFSFPPIPPIIIQFGKPSRTGNVVIRMHISDLVTLHGIITADMFLTRFFLPLAIQSQPSVRRQYRPHSQRFKKRPHQLPFQHSDRHLHQYLHRRLCRVSKMEGFL